MKFPLLAVTECLALCLQHIPRLEDNNVTSVGFLNDMRTHFNRALNGFQGGGQQAITAAESFGVPDNRVTFGLIMIANELLAIRQDPQGKLNGRSLEKHMRSFMKKDARTKDAKRFLKKSCFRAEKPSASWTMVMLQCCKA